MSINFDSLKRLALTIRTLSIDGVEKANSGHPGLPLGAADYSAVLWGQHMRFNPKDPNWANRDRFILSAGHGSMLVYSLLNLFGYDLPMSELQKFRQWESKTPGHPEFGWTPGVETTTGPLGQGFANGVGMALSGKMLAAQYGEDLFNFKVYGIVSDGDLMEGVHAEAASLAGHMGLDNLIYFYDDNLISLAGPTSVCFQESVPKRFEAYNWYVQSCDGHDMQAVQVCIENAKKEKSRPSIICCRTLLGKGSPNKANTHEAHGAPLGKDEVAATKKNLGWPEDAQFLVPDDVRAFCAAKVEAGQTEYESWQKSFAAWSAANPEKTQQLKAQSSREIPEQLKTDLLAAFAEKKKDATRNLSGQALQVIAKHLPYFVGGSADLDPSTKTYLKGHGDVKHHEFAGRNIHYGVREHAMGSAANGLAYQQCWIPYTATFLVFADYMRPPMRLAALSHLQTFFIFTHDSFWVGEDGPTHEPIEQIQTIRAIPNMYLYRPADGIEVAMCYWAALQTKNRPSSFAFTRQNVSPLERSASFNADSILKGGYVVQGEENRDVTIVATGSEVELAIDAAKLLTSKGVKARIVSMPCVERFMEQEKSFRDAIIPPSSKRIAIEAGITTGWERVVGSDALLIGINHYGASAPGELLAEKFGFTAPTVAAKVGSFLGV
jgi:transketolase